MKFEIGQKGEFKKKITETNVYDFAELSGDFNPVHMDKKMAEESIYGKQIAHGMLGASLISTVLGMYMPGPGTIYLDQSLHFLKPVFLNDTLTAVVTIIDIDDKRKAKLKTDVMNQDGKIVISGEAKVKLPN